VTSRLMVALVTNFSDMPDLQHTASHNDAMIGLRDHILPKRCKRNPI
jgi:hypothetical protein